MQVKTRENEEREKADALQSQRSALTRTKLRAMNAVQAVRPSDGTEARDSFVQNIVSNL